MLCSFGYFFVCFVYLLVARFFVLFCFVFHYRYLYVLCHTTVAVFQTHYENTTTLHTRYICLVICILQLGLGSALFRFAIPVEQLISVLRSCFVIDFKFAFCFRFLLCSSLCCSFAVGFQVILCAVDFQFTSGSVYFLFFSLLSLITHTYTPKHTRTITDFVIFFSCFPEQNKFVLLADDAH